MKLRILTGSIGGLLFLTLLIIGDIWFGMAVTMLAVIAYYECLKMSTMRLSSIPVLLGGLFLLLILYKPLADLEYFNAFPAPVPFPTLFIGFVLVFLVLMVFSKNQFMVEHLGLMLIGVVYVGAGFAAMMEFRFTEGIYTLFFILLMVWSADSGAYFIGKKWGKHKLWPSISPNKTIEGLIGGVLVSLTVGLIYHFVTDMFTHALAAVGVIVLIALAGQMGDLIESAIKRFYKVKDSGAVLPGHGGVFDRFDSLLFVFVLLQLLQVI